MLLLALTTWNTETEAPTPPLAHAIEYVDEILRVRESECADSGTVHEEIVALRQGLKWAKGCRRFNREVGSVVHPVKNTYRPLERNLENGEPPTAARAVPLASPLLGDGRDPNRGPPPQLELWAGTAIA